ncbi:Protein of unknown function [Cotesia congregata]|uniref:Uncharacterized protein n=1 Tax=Cotesia congregata TaxID=51543 RepID=A0A8J2HFF6_COTCN|nr:Protein of unknown function [Cotesia congregata]
MVEQTATTQHYHTFHGRENSTIDLVWTNCEGIYTIHDFEVQEIKHDYGLAMRWSKLVQVNPSDSIADLQNKLQAAIKKTALELKMTKGLRPPFRKRWYDNDCKELKKIANRELRKYRKPNSNSTDKTTYLKARKDYLMLCKDKKRNYHADILNKINNTRYSTDFWKAIRTFQNRPFTTPPIEAQKWEEFYTNIYQPAQTNPSHDLVGTAICCAYLGSTIHKRGREHTGLAQVPKILLLNYDIINKTTANALVQAELNRIPLSAKIWEDTWRWIIRILKIEANRLPRICFIKSVESYLNGVTDNKYNWTAQIAEFINQTNPYYARLLHNLNSEAWEKVGKQLITIYEKQLTSTISTISDNCQYLQTPIRNRESNNYYLNCNTPWCMKRLVTQIRCASSFGAVISANGKSDRFDPSNSCPCCKSDHYDTTTIH